MNNNNTTTTTTPNTNNILYEYEVLYHKRRLNKVHKKGLSRLDGILSIHSSPSYLVTLKTVSNDNDGDGCSDDEEDDNDDDVNDDDEDDNNGGKQSYKSKMKKMRRQFQKSKSSKSSSSFSKSNTKSNTILYSNKNIQISKSVMEKPNGLDIDDIVLCGMWECQIVEPYSHTKPCSNSGIHHHRKKQSTLMTKNRITNKGFNITSKSSLSSSSLSSSIIQQRRKISPLQSLHKVTTSNIINRKPPIQPLPKRQSDTVEEDDNDDESETETDEMKATNNKIPMMKQKKRSFLLSSSSSSSLKKRKLVPTSIHSKSRTFTKPFSSKSISSLSTSITIKKDNKKITTNTSSTLFHGAIGDIQVPSSIKSILKPHQIQGVVFLWNCLTAGRPSSSSSSSFASLNQPIMTTTNDSFFDSDEDDGRFSSSSPSPSCSRYGAILADEMGLGKTLMTITVLLALYRSNRSDRFVIVCPSSLVNNWAKEFDKWIGKASQPKRVVIRKGGEEGLKLLKAFVPLKPQKSEVLIVSYDLFRMNSKILSQSKNIGLLVVDEGHRLKNTSGSLTLSALETLNCKARLLITGTPIQNNLSEFYNVANFALPGILGDLNTFRRVYERPISVSNHKNATMYQKEEGRRVSKELDKITSTFMIRRLQKDILQSLLPPRHEVLLFCRPSTVQCDMYKRLTSQSTTLSDPLPLLTKLRKLCTHPLLLSLSGNDDDVVQAPQDTGLRSSGKLDILDSLLHAIRCNCPSDKVVVVSNFTSALSVIEDTIIKKREWHCLRLDGTVEQSSRQALVDSFNGGSTEQSFVFLLSSKAGGCGLNLIGANRLIMVDGDWNPATDLQAMARIYRQGQTKPTFIYRLFTSGTVEEVIYQRQTQKNNLASFSDIKASSKGKQSKSTRFTPEELRDCFTLKEDCGCDTKNKIGGDWKDYYGEPSLRSQNCLDVPLLKVAKTKPNELTYVHIVPQREENADEKEQSEESIVSQDDVDALMDSSSEEEAEFE